VARAWLTLPAGAPKYAAMSKRRQTAALAVRNATTRDIADIVALVNRAYADVPGYELGMIQGQITAYPEGQFVVEYEGAIVGYAASFRISADIAMRPHTWSEITGGGYAARHDPSGEWLYGMEVCVDPDRRRLRIGQRLYDARRGLCEALALKGIVFGGRMPGWRRRRKSYPDPNAYLEAVREKQINDPIVNFHLRAGCEPIGVLKDYLPSDTASGGYATHMVWCNPYTEEMKTESALAHGPKDAVRVATVQFQQRMVDSFEGFIANAGVRIRL